MKQPIEINNLTVDHITTLLESTGLMTDLRKLATEIVEQKRFGSEGQFKNGYRLVTLHQHGYIFGILTPQGDLTQIFSIYEPQHISYREKHDCFFITGHETLTEVSSEGVENEEYTR